jgi:hypothetical protein
MKNIEYINNKKLKLVLSRILMYIRLNQANELMGIFIFLWLCWEWEHCGIHRSSYYRSNMSYLNSPPPSFISLLYSSLPLFLVQFQPVSFFQVYTYGYSIVPHSPSHSLSSHPLPPTDTSPHNRICSALLFSDFVKEK